jgi:hypothetical protein
VFRPGRCRQHLDPQHPNPRWRSNVRCCWVWPGCDGVFRTGQWQFPTWAVWSTIGVGGVFQPRRCRKRPDPRRRSWGWLGCGGVFRPGRWQRGPVQVLAAWSGLGGVGGVRLGCGGGVVRIWAGAVSLFSTSLRGKWGKRSSVSTTLEFFCSEMT